MIEPVPVLKDEENNLPVPTVWRPTLRAMAGALTARNFRLEGLPGVDPLDEAEAAAIAASLEDHGCTLDALPEETWETSVCQWQLDYWDVLVDLFTVEEGRSDLVLHVMVFEQDADFLFRTHLVYVP